MQGEQGGGSLDRWGYALGRGLKLITDKTEYVYKHVYSMFMYEEKTNK